jgi:hypothetical protein
MIHMQWHKDGERENKEVMVHSSDLDAWKALDNFDPEFARDVRNVRIGLTTDGLTPFSDNATSYSCWPMFVVPYNLPHSLCMKYEFMFLYLIVPGVDHPRAKNNVMLKPLFDELKELWNGDEAYDSQEAEIHTLGCISMVDSRFHGLRYFFRMERSWEIDLSDMLLQH